MRYLILAVIVLGLAACAAPKATTCAERDYAPPCVRPTATPEDFSEFLSLMRLAYEDPAALPEGMNLRDYGGAR